MEKVLFKEEQRFRQWWIWMITAFALLAVIVPLVSAIVEEQAQVNSSETARLIIFGVLAVLFFAVVLIVLPFIKLNTKITENGIYVTYFPFVRKWKKFPAQEIEKYEIRRYRARLEYGGYGMRKRRKVGQAFSISGNIGLQLYFKNGKRILIGTQKKQAIEHAMVKLMGAGKQHVSVEKFKQETESIVKRKVKKILIIIAIEIVLAILIFSMIQIFK